ncbi:MAG: hypothetical protein MR812_06355 [Clostridia bacterium]|nr:hypothetical protein [Clostridia bacterium]
MKDDDLTPGLIISKYQFVADDTSMDYDRKSKMIKEGQKSLGKLRNQEAFNRLLGRSVTNYGQQAADLDAKLGAQLKSSAFGSGFFDEFGLGLAHKGTHFIADKLNKPELTQAIDQDRQFMEAAKKTNPKSANVGSAAGGITRDAGLYLLGAPVVEGGLAGIGTKLPRVGALVNKNALTKFSANVLGQQAIDTAIMQPVVALQGVGEGKTKAEIWEEMKQQAFTDLLFNAGMGVAGAGIKAIGKGVQARRTAKELAAQQAEEAAKGYVDNMLRPEYIALPPRASFYAGTNGVAPDLSVYDLSNSALRSRMRAYAEEAAPLRLTGDVRNNADFFMGSMGTAKDLQGYRRAAAEQAENVAQMQAGAFQNPLRLTGNADTGADFYAGSRGTARSSADYDNAILRDRERFKQQNGFYPEEREALEKELETVQNAAMNRTTFNQIKNTEGLEAAKGWLENQWIRAQEINEMLYGRAEAEAMFRQNVADGVDRGMERIFGNNKFSKEIMEKIKNGGLSAKERQEIFRKILESNDPKATQQVDKALKQELQNTKVSISAMDASNIPDFQSFRKKYFGKLGGVSIDGKNIPIDSKYQELAEKWPQYFPSNIVNPAEQLEQMARVADSLVYRQITLAESMQPEELAEAWKTFNRMLDAATNQTKHYDDFTKRYPKGVYQGKQVMQKKTPKNEVSASELSKMEKDPVYRVYDGKKGIQTETKEKMPSGMNSLPDPKTPEYKVYNGKQVLEERQMSENVLKEELTSPDSAGGVFDETMTNTSAKGNTVLHDRMEGNTGGFSVSQKKVAAMLRQEGPADFSNMTPEDVKALHDMKYRTKERMKKAERQSKLTGSEKGIVERMLHGEIAPEDVKTMSGVNSDGILSVYRATKDAKKAERLVKNYKTGKGTERREKVAELVGDIQIGGKDGWKEPGLSISLMRLSPERATEKVVPKEIAKKINDNIFAKLHDNERDKTLFVRDTLDKVRPLKIGTKKKYTVTMDNAPTKLSESGMVQYLGEKRFDLKKLESSTNLTAEEMKRMEQLRGEIKEAENQIDTGAMERINKGISEIQKIYKEIHPKINEVLIRNGYDPVGYIDGYFPHMFFNDPTDTVGKALNKLGINLGYTELPADIAGKTENFRPGRKFSGNLLKREGVRTDYDALRGLENYLFNIGDVIYHTDDIRTLRALEDHLRYQLSPTAVKEEIDAVHNNFDLDLEQKQAELDRLYEKNANLFKDEHNKTLQNYVTYLRRYTDLLAGKKHALDRGVETDITGRGAYSRMDALNQRIAANMVGGNIGSALTNVIPFTQGFAPISMKNRAKGLQEGIAAVFSKNPDALTKKSAFLTTRTNTDKLYKTAADKFSDFAGGLMDIMDKFSTQSIWRGRYYDNINKGLPEKEAIREADDYARRLFGGRSKGAVPPIMQAKNPISKALTMFQLEVNNQIDFLTKDIPKEAKGSVVKGLRMYGEILAASYFFNDVYEKMTGRRSALDPVGIALDSVADFSGTEVRNSIDIIADLLQGEGLQLTEEKEKKSVSDSFLNLGENIGANVPFIGGLLFDGGRIPQSSALPNLYEAAKAMAREGTGDAEAGYAGEVLKTELMKPLSYLLLPSGGGQIKKTLQGLETMNEGGSYKMGSEGEKLQFAVDTKDPASWVKAALFGKWALPEGQAYISKEVNGLSEKRTEMQREMQQQFGTTPKAYFDTFQNINKAETREGKVSALKSSGLTDAEKEYIYKREIFTGKTQIEDFDKMRSFGLSFDQAAGAQTALEGIDKKYDEMLDDGLKNKNTMAANEKYDYINQMSIPAGQKQKMLDNFANRTIFIPQETSATMLTEKYQAVSGFMGVNEFERLKQAVSNTTWTKGVDGAKSRALKATIDSYTQGMPYAEKRVLYETFGVGKTYW